ncbi:MAG TPA: glutamate-cysteine ligase family protein [Longimicrobiales bacterium]|nr:glutamate-cysteine ligase family protein [Longimicrobiales bacterium]
MGEQDVHPDLDPGALRSFTKAILRDLKALERVIEEGMIESGIRRCGAEQELFLVNAGWRPAPVSEEVLDNLPADAQFTTELARFNLEINLRPLVLEGRCFSAMEERIRDLVRQVEEAAQKVDARVVLTGILPTLSKSDLSLDNITPRPRYYALNEALTRMRGGEYRLWIEGTDELNLKHDSVMLEACNTSAQFHLQVSAEEFVDRYNVAQVATAPILAAAVNSPLLFGKRLWAETRIALFQQAIDTRSATLHLREMSPRVRFGEDWARNSVVELFQEDIARFRVLMAKEVDEDPFEMLDRGEIPRLQALQLHNSTIYRWNRPCYGITDCKPHLRIECRVFPSGPSIVDEVADAAFWMGLVMGISGEYGDVTEHMEFDVAKGNFLAAARLGLNARFDWFGGETVSARRLIMERLLPLAREGLEELGIDEGDVGRYLGVIGDRVSEEATGASWILRSLAGMPKDASRGERMAAITGATVARQEGGAPAHEWELAALSEAGSWRPNFFTVEQYMRTSLFTVNEDELVDLVAFLMDREEIRHVLVEDDEHRLVGLVSYRSLLRLMADGAASKEVPVKEIMARDPISVSPETPTLDAIEIMRDRGVSCLPVVKNGKLVGLVTERDFMPIAYQLLQARLELEEA